MNLSDEIACLLEDLSVQTDRPTPESVLPPVSRLIEPKLGCVCFSRDHYVRHAIHLGEDWEVMLIAWETGQKTPIHDHRGVAGSMIVLDGGLVEEVFDTPNGRPDLLVRSEYGTGAASIISPTMLHRLMPRKGRSISLHIYRPPLRKMGIWETEGMTEIRASGYDTGPEVFSARASG